METTEKTLSPLTADGGSPAPKKRRFEIDILNGPLVRSILLYSLPVMIGSLIQVLFNAADTIVLGNMADMNAVSSVGATGPIVALLVNSFIGLSGGTNVILARVLGEKKDDEVKACVDTSIVFSFVMGVAIAIFGFFFSHRFLVWTSCPEECLEGATLYLRLYFLSVPAIMIYNFGAAIIRVSGDTQRPLYYLIASGLLNVLMNILFCAILTQKVAAVAIATLASQVLGAVLVMVQLCRAKGACSFHFRGFRFDPKMLRRILRIGIPGAVNSSLYSISNLQIQSAINAWGPAAIAGNTAAASVEGMVASFTNALHVAALAFIGQNIGVGNRERVKKSIWFCYFFGIGLGLLLGLGLTALGRPILNLYIPGEEDAIACGIIRMHHILAFYAIASMSGLYGSALQAFGYPSQPMICGIVFVLVFRVIWMSFVYPSFHSLESLYICYTISWILNDLAHMVCFIIAYRKYCKGYTRRV